MTTQPTIGATVNGGMRALHNTVEPWAILVSKGLQGALGAGSYWKG